MGFYDARCMITGVSLKGADAALVLLRKTGKTHVPIALAIKGNYDRLGAIEGIHEDHNSKLILGFFHDKLKKGEFVVNQEYLRTCRCFPLERIEELVRCFERSMHDHPRAALLEEKPVVFALIARAVFDGVANDANYSEPAATVAQQLFKSSPLAQEIYANGWDVLGSQVRALGAVNALLRSRNLHWQPATDDLFQHYGEEMQQYLAEAKEAFRESSSVLAALEEYETEVSELLEDE